MSRFTPRRRALLLAAAAQAAPLPLRAQSSKPLRLVVPFPAGGTADVLPRILAEKMRAQFPQGVVVENRVGAGGNIGAEQVFRSEPDGLTLMAAPPGPIAINQSLYAKLAYDAQRWVPVTVLATVPNVLAVSPQLPVRSVAELVALARSKPGALTYASQGHGSTSHLTAHMLMAATGIELNHVPYKGTTPALTDLMGGQVDMFCDNLGSSGPQHKSGRLRILAVADSVRAPSLPDVPTFAEAGFPAVHSVTWFAVVAPPGTPDDAVGAVQRAIADALALPDVRQKFAEQSAEPKGWSPAETARFVRAEAQKWAGIVKSAKVSLD